MQRLDCLFEQQFPLHWCQVAWWTVKKKKNTKTRKKIKGFPLYFWAGIMLSIDSPFSSFFSISTISLTPSTTHCTCSTSEEPRRSALEMSNTPPTEAVSTPPERNEWRSNKSTNGTDVNYTSSWRSINISMPLHLCIMFCVCIPVPRFCRRSLVRISSNLGCVLSLGSLTWTPPRSPVPRLEGHVRMKPRCSFHMNPWLCFLKISSICQSRMHKCSQSAGDNRFMRFFIGFSIPSEDQRRSAWTLPSCCHPAAWKWHADDPPRSPRPGRSCSHCACN